MRTFGISVRAVVKLCHSMAAFRVVGGIHKFGWGHTLVAHHDALHQTTAGYFLRARRGLRATHAYCVTDVRTYFITRRRFVEMGNCARFSYYCINSGL